MQTKIFSTEDIKDLKVGAIARKHRCSSDYVYRVLKGDRERNTELAQKIVKDANAILEVLECETKIETA